LELAHVARKMVIGQQCRQFRGRLQCRLAHSRLTRNQYSLPGGANRFDAIRGRARHFMTLRIQSRRELGYLAGQPVFMSPRHSPVALRHAVLRASTGGPATPAPCPFLHPTSTPGEPRAWPLRNRVARRPSTQNVRGPNLAPRSKLQSLPENFDKSIGSKRSAAVLPIRLCNGWDFATIPVPTHAGGRGA